MDLAEADSAQVYFQKIDDEINKLQLALHLPTLEDMQKVLQVIWTASRCAERFYLNQEFSESTSRTPSTWGAPSTPFPYESLQETGHLASDEDERLRFETLEVDEDNEESLFEAMALTFGQHYEYLKNGGDPEVPSSDALHYLCCQFGFIHRDMSFEARMMRMRKLQEGASGERRDFWLDFFAVRVALWRRKGRSFFATRGLTGSVDLAARQVSTCGERRRSRST